MADFVNTIDLLGDEVVAKAIIEKTITEFNDDTLTRIGRYAFSFCASLTSVNLPNLIETDSYVFRNCSSLKSVSLPNLTSVRQMMFGSCSVLEILDFPKVTSISLEGFYQCSAVHTIILRSETLCTLGNINAISPTKFGKSDEVGTLIVPRALTAEYPNATNWSNMLTESRNNRVLALEDYTIDGTITGEIDWDKLNGGN